MIVMTYMVIEECHGPFPVSAATMALGVSRSGYYRWLHSKEDVPVAGGDMLLREEIQRVAVEYPRYGYRRIAAELRNQGLCAPPKRVLRLMRMDNLLCARKQYRLCTTDSSHGEKVYPNLARGMSLSGVNQLWVADITYIRLEREFVYLAMVLDVFSRRCVGWELDRRIDTGLALSALRKALKARARDGVGLAGLVHHSDQGVQYASKEYVECLQEHGILISMSRRGNPYDNAYAESFMKTLKYEEVYLKEYDTFKEAWENIEHFIDQVYNLKRLHSGIGYQSPMEFEKTLNINIVA
jgi:transposase InsO family protein